jgi:hypothetical protein
MTVLQRAARHAGNAAVQAVIVRGILEDLASFPSEAASSVSAGGAVYSEPPLLKLGPGGDYVRAWPEEL